MDKREIKRVAVFGSTGSIGINALKVIAAFPGRFQVAALSSFSNIKLLEKQIKEFSPLMAAIARPGLALKAGRGLSSKGVKIYGPEGLNIIAEDDRIDIVVMAVSGFAAIYPLISAIKKGKHICLANKESIVAAGDIIMGLVKKHNALLIPVDSEHNAIFQCLHSGPAGRINRLYITGSGGPLRRVDEKKFPALSVKQVLNHPRWKMGKKITVDSATLMNKGLEIIEARHLFGVPIDKIKLLIHPEAVIHSMCEFVDGSIIAQLGVTDMKLPIQYALTYPDRLDTPFARLDLLDIKNLAVMKADTLKFPCLTIALAAARLAGTAPAVLNAADEIAVKAFLDEKISFTRIPGIIEDVLRAHRFVSTPSIEQIFEADLWAREKAGCIVSSLGRP
ncbi:MAG: 1-deoxy-D-xylulose-5-phosphate reductoisomerase [Candidatus Omnitrophica bacterium]|jgi:1-deoxy-D-xylulose-5-phosphate reductoisomerase|nr:1-deoxy-D-xylulose-5-phosphate reductoisomerase [Candidatus Omnitrophota bacterium]